MVGATSSDGFLVETVFYCVFRTSTHSLPVSYELKILLLLIFRFHGSMLHGRFVSASLGGRYL